MMKNTAAILLALVMMLSVSVIHAQTDYPGADKLKEFGFINGDGKGNLNVDKPLTRAEACVVMAEMHGELDKAWKYSKKSVFSDINPTDWYAPVVNYAHYKGWVEGFNGRFNPTGNVTVQAWAKFMLVALRRYEKWETAIGDLKNLDIKIYAVDPLQIKRGEAFDTMWAVVNKPAKGDTRPLGEMLGKLKPKDGEITKVVLPSLKLMDVTVSVKLKKESAEKSENYIFVDSESKKAIEVAKIEYDADADVIHFFFKDALRIGSNVILSKLDVEPDGEGILLPDGFGEIRVDDTVAPSIAEVRSLGTKAIKVVFSEPIRNKDGELQRDDFIFDRQLAVKKVYMTDDDRAAIIEFDTVLKGELGVYPQKSIKDYAGHSLITGKQSVKIKYDETPFKIEKVLKMTSTELVLKMSKGMAQIVKYPKYIVVNGATPEVETELKGDVLILRFLKDYLPVGKSVLSFRRGTMTDYSGISSPQYEYEVDLAPDKEIPYSEGVVFEKQNQVKIPFNEPLKRKGGKLISVSNYKLFQDGRDVSKLIGSVQYDPKSFSVYINFKENLFGDYRIQIEELLDLSDNDGSTYFDFHIGDITPPDPEKWIVKVYDARGRNQMLVVRFDEEMSVEGKGSVLDPENFMIGDTTFDNLNKELLTFEISAERDVVKILYPGSRFGGTDFGVEGASKLAIAKVADIAGNAVSGFVNYLNIQNNSGMSIENADMIAPNVLRITVKEVIESLDHGDLVVESAGKRIYGDVQEVRTEKGSTYFDIVFENPPTFPLTVRTVRGGSLSEYGERFVNSNLMSVKDKVGPALQRIDGADQVSYNKATRTITMVFNEDIYENIVSLLSFEVPGITVEEIKAFKNEIKIVVADVDRMKVTKDQLILQKLEIRDKYGNVTEGIVTKVK